MDASLELNENEKAWQELAITSSIMRRAWEMELARVGLTAPQTMVLGFLHVSPKPLTPMGLSLPVRQRTAHRFCPGDSHGG
jgi:hypothetical protein